MRYKYNCIHKYASCVLSYLEQLIAKTDFRKASQVEIVIVEFQIVAQMLGSHVTYQQVVLEKLPKKGESTLYAQVKADHEQLHEALMNLQIFLDTIRYSVDEHERVELGFQFYLHYRKFVADSLLRFHRESTSMLPELQRIYTHEELHNVEMATYQAMASLEGALMEIVFPHINAIDREAFLAGLKDAQSEKFLETWSGIQDKLDPHERDDLIKRLAIPIAAPLY